MHCKIGDDKVELLVRGAAEEKTIKELYMKGSHFFPQNTISLVSTLRTNHTLIYLNLRHCYIDSAGACQLVSDLCTDVTLQELNLEHNPIGMRGATALLKRCLETSH